MRNYIGPRTKQVSVSKIGPKVRGMRSSSVMPHSWRVSSTNIPRGGHHARVGMSTTKSLGKQMSVEDILKKHFGG